MGAFKNAYGSSNQTRRSIGRAAPVRMSGACDHLSRLQMRIDRARVGRVAGWHLPHAGPAQRNDHQPGEECFDPIKSGVLQ